MTEEITYYDEKTEQTVSLTSMMKQQDLSVSKLEELAKDVAHNHMVLLAQLLVHTERLEAQDDGEAITRGRVNVLTEDFTALSRSFNQLSADFLQSHDRLGERMEAIEEGQPIQAPDNVEIYKALIAAQGEIRNADKNVDNEFTHKKYADLASVMNAVREPLANNGLAIFQVTATIDEVATVDTNPAAIGIKTTLIHTSGQTIVDITAMLAPKLDPQGVGSCRTYMRRYSVLALCSIAGANDDDAEATKKDPNDYPRISIAEVEKIIYVADDLFGDHADDAVKLMLEKLFGGKAVVGDIPEGQMEPAVNYLENAKKARDKKIKTAKAIEAAEKKEAEEGK